MTDFNVAPTVGIRQSRDQCPSLEVLPLWLAPGLHSPGVEIIQFIVSSWTQYQLDEQSFDPQTWQKPSLCAVHNSNARILMHPPSSYPSRAVGSGKSCYADLHCS